MSRPCQGCRWCNDRDWKCKNVTGPRFGQPIGPEESCTAHEKWPEICAYTYGVICGETNPERCLRCGWNPEVAKRRLGAQKGKRYVLKPDLRKFFSSEREYKEYLRQRREADHARP